MNYPVEGFSAPLEYVGDVMNVLPDDVPNYPVTDPVGAAGVLTDYVRARIRAVRGRDPRRPAVALSDGIDSVFVASVMAEECPEALAVTFDYSVSGEPTPAGRAAIEVAEHLGLEHVMVCPRAGGRDSEAWQMVSDVVRRLGTPDVWEVGAGLVVTAVSRAAAENGADGPVFTGEGGDELFKAPLDGEDTSAWWEHISNEVNRVLIRGRNIPDFYERLLDEPARWVATWRTRRALDVARQIHPRVLADPEGVGDRMVFRTHLMDNGLPAHLAESEKNSLQYSSGAVGLFVDLLRHDLASNGVHLAYTNPEDEDAATVAARAALERMH